SILDQAHAEAQARGSVVGFAMGSLFHSYVDLASGDLAQAQPHAVTSLTAPRQVGWFGLPAVIAGVIDVLIERDRLPEEQQLLELPHFTTAPAAVAADFPF